MTAQKKPLILRVGTDILLFVLASLCFGLFIRNSISARTSAEGGLPIAQVQSGSLERKRSGMVSFIEVSKGAPLFNRDSIWVGEGKSADILFEDGTELKILEKTFLVLRKQGGIEKPIQVFTGEVRVKSTNHTSVIEIDEKQKGVGKHSPEPQPSGGLGDVLPMPVENPSPEPVIDNQLYPRPNTIFFVSGGKSETAVSFSWPEPIDGILTVRNEAQKEVARINVKAEKFAKVRLPLRHAYTWQIINKLDGPGVGPHRFEIVPFDPKVLKKTMENPSQQIELIN